MVPNVHVMTDDEEPFDNPERHKRIGWTLHFLTMTLLNIAFEVSNVSQFMSTPMVKYWVVLKQILCYLKGALGVVTMHSNHNNTYFECFVNVDWDDFKINRRSFTVYCVLLEGTWQHEEVRSKVLYLDQVQNLSIELHHSLRVKLFG